MPTPFDPILRNIVATGYHSHRNATHSDVLTAQILTDLNSRCPAFSEDFGAGRFRVWQNVTGPDGRNTDLLVGAANPDGTPDLRNVRIIIEHKSVVTAHRNRNARCQDIEREMRASHFCNPRTIVVGTLIIGTCPEVLNVPDCVKKHADLYRFETQILPRLSTGDQTLWQEFRTCVSHNTADDPRKTMAYFQRLPVRAMADSHEMGLDYMLYIPMAIDNVNPPRLSTLNGVDPCESYEEMISHICRVYQLRWYGRS